MQFASSWQREPERLGEGAGDRNKADGGEKKAVASPVYEVGFASAWPTLSSHWNDLEQRHPVETVHAIYTT